LTLQASLISLLRSAWRLEKLSYLGLVELAMIERYLKLLAPA
jgi:hypothetical protein